MYYISGCIPIFFSNMDVAIIEQIINLITCCLMIRLGIMVQIQALLKLYISSDNVVIYRSDTNHNDSKYFTECKNDNYFTYKPYFMSLVQFFNGISEFLPSNKNCNSS